MPSESDYNSKDSLKDQIKRVQQDAAPWIAETRDMKSFDRNQKVENNPEREDSLRPECQADMDRVQREISPLNSTIDILKSFEPNLNVSTPPDNDKETLHRGDYKQKPVDSPFEDRKDGYLHSQPKIESGRLPAPLFPSTKPAQKDGHTP